MSKQRILLTEGARATAPGSCNRSIGFAKYCVIFVDKAKHEQNNGVAFYNWGEGAIRGEEGGEGRVYILSSQQKRFTEVNWVDKPVKIGEIKNIC